MQIPILNGIYTDESPDFRTSYPRNLIPVPKEQGISQGYLRPADGIVQFGSGPGVDRGGINWNNKCYRVMGTKLVSIDSGGNSTTIDDVEGNGQVTLDYSFDYLAVASNEKLFLYDGASVRQVTDTDLGSVIDMIWIDGYFMTTDGSFLVVTDIGDPFSVNPLKYGSSEVNPDRVVGLKKLRNEVYAINRYTIEVFNNVGGSGFPFQRIEGAHIERGAIGTHASCIFMEAIVFLGGALNEAPAIYIGANASTTKISTREIDQILLEYTEAQLEQTVLETRTEKGHKFLYVHLPDQTLVFDGNASQAAGEPVWFPLTSSITGRGQYQAKNFVWCYNKWLCGNPTGIVHGYLTSDISSHYGQTVGWDFATTIIYNESNGAIFHELELVALTGRVPLGDDPTIWTQYSLDGVTWSQEKAIQAGKQGERHKRLLWLQQGNMRQWRIQRFRGTSDTHISIVRLEARLEPLNV
jgi:hypothetical protein